MGSKQRTFDERAKDLDVLLRPFLPDCRVSAGACLTNEAEKLIIKTIIVITKPLAITA